MNQKGFYDPGSSENLVRAVVRELLEQPPINLPIVDQFEGPGVYAIYYVGPFTSGAFKPYEPFISDREPIYVGKAIPKGQRTGKPASGKERPLFDRLRKHATSLGQVGHLEVGQFRVRYLPVVPVWTNAVETLLIQRFQPLWCTVVSGFGINAPGEEGRGKQKRSMWDTLHPGRPYAANLTPNKLSAQEIMDLVAAAANHRKNLSGGGIPL